MVPWDRPRRAGWGSRWHRAPPPSGSGTTSGHVGAELALGAEQRGPVAKAGLRFPGEADAPPRRIATQGAVVVAVCGCGGLGPLPAPRRPGEEPVRGDGNSQSTASPRGEPVPGRASAHEPPVPPGLSVHQATLPPEGPPTWTRLPRLPSAPSPITTCTPRSRYRIPRPHPAVAGLPPHPLPPTAPTPCWTPRVTLTWTTPWMWRGTWRSCCGAPWTVSGSPMPSRDGRAPGPPPPAPALRGLCCVRVSVPGGGGWPLPWRFALCCPETQAGVRLFGVYALV